ncbi:MAG: hypothetical protein ACRDVE_12080, partial [Actinocrinis sp.]
MSEAARSARSGNPPSAEAADSAYEQARLLARAAQAGAARRTSATYRQSVAMSRRSLLRTTALGG